MEFKINFHPHFILKIAGNRGAGERRWGQRQRGPISGCGLKAGHFRAISQTNEHPNGKEVEQILTQKEIHNNDSFAIYFIDLFVQNICFLFQFFIAFSMFNFIEYLFLFHYSFLNLN
jgi:hypothetical protein